jgi:hypothetical protein
VTPTIKRYYEEIDDKNSKHNNNDSKWKIITTISLLIMIMKKIDELAIANAKHPVSHVSTLKVHYPFSKTITIIIRIMQ